MKKLKQYIEENVSSVSLDEGLRLSICDKVKVFACESLRIGICDEVKVSACESLRIRIDDKPYTASPTTWNELRQIIEERYKEQGPGTKQNPVDFNDIDVSGITSFYNRVNYIGIFDTIKFEYIDISDWDVSNVKDMSYMFCQCDNLKSVGDISNWNTLNVEKTYAMFLVCKNLISIGDISKWNISRVKDMRYMFEECKQLKSVGDLNKWDISNVEYVKHMFYQSGIINIPDWYEK